MAKHSFKEWFAVTRYWSFPVSTMPVLASFAYVFSKGLLPGGVMPWVLFVLCLLGVVLLHSAGNVLSDYYDFKTGVDNENAFAVPNLVFGKFQPIEYLTFSIILFIAGVTVGAVIAILSGPALWIIGGVGVLLTALYSFLKYHALGDLDIFIIFGILPVLGTAYAVTGELHWDALVLSIPIGIITVSVLHANNTFDTETDRAAGIKTFGMLIGGKAASVLYAAYMVIPFACIIAAVATGQLHFMALLCLVAAIPAWKNFRQACTYDKAGLDAMKGLDQASAKLQLVFSVLLSAGLVFSVLF
jgi:1,4-dihydroxy-2-naphthoate octaprenyltransferase